MTLDEKFELYHKQNPQIFELFQKFARRAKQAGFKRFGAKAIMERVRWEVYIEDPSDEQFKINNNYTSRYVRLLEKTNPEFKGFFEKRTLISRAAPQRRLW